MSSTTTKSYKKDKKGKKKELSIGYEADTEESE